MNQLTTKFLLFQAIYLSSRCKKTQIFQGFYLSRPSPGRHELVAELTVPRDLHVHFTTFENSIFVQKRTLVKLKVINILITGKLIYFWKKILPGPFCF